MPSSRHILIAAAAVLALLAAACGSGGDEPAADTGDDTATDTTDDSAEEPADTSEAAEATTIRYFTFSAAPDHLETLDAMIAAFNEVYPDVTVEVETAPFDDYFTLLQTQLAGGDAPDAFEVNYENFVSLASRDALADLGPFIAGDDTFDPGMYYPRAYEAFARDGSQYGLPASYSTVLLYYNKDLFDAAGVDYPTADWTWDDERAAAEQLTDPDNGVWGFFAGIQFWEFYKTAAQNGCDILDGDAVTIDSAACVEALEYMLSFTEDSLQPTEAEMGGVSDGDMFVQGELAMITTGIWMFGAFADAPFEWDVVVEPGNTEKAHHFFSNGAAVAADSDQQEAAYRWVSFLTGSPETARIRVDASWELPTLTEQSLFDSYLSTDDRPANRQAVLDALESAIVPPVIERQAEMQDAINAVIERAALGELSAEEALTQAKANVEALLDG
jgi:multiple sugar transport system substrate-binding protein